MKLPQSLHRHVHATCKKVPITPSSQQAPLEPRTPSIRRTYSDFNLVSSSIQDADTDTPMPVFETPTSRGIRRTLSQPDLNRFSFVVENNQQQTPSSNVPALNLLEVSTPLTSLENELPLSIHKKRATLYATNTTG